MTPERAAAVARTERELGDRFEHYGLPEPHDKATATVRWLQANGWRVHPALVDRPATTRTAPRAVAQAAVAEIRSDLERKRGHRPELADRCDCRGCRPEPAAGGDA